MSTDEVAAAVDAERARCAEIARSRAEIPCADWRQACDEIANEIEAGQPA